MLCSADEDIVREFERAGIDMSNYAQKQGSIAFDQTEYDKLRTAFELARDNKRYNSDRISKISSENDRLQDLIDHQREREERKEALQEQLKEISSRSGIWESSRNKESRQELVEQLQKLEDQEEESRNAAQTIKDNERVVLSLSKEIRF